MNSLSFNPKPQPNKHLPAWFHAAFLWPTLTSEFPKFQDISLLSLLTLGTRTTVFEIVCSATPSKWNALLIFFWLAVAVGLRGWRGGGCMLPGEGLALNVLIKLRSIAIPIGLTWLSVACLNREKKKRKKRDEEEKQDHSLRLYLNFPTQSDKIDFSGQKITLKQKRNSATKWKGYCTNIRKRNSQELFVIHTTKELQPFTWI